ncbi:MAG: peptidoglycan-binding domain-containing protein [archaeon]
MLYLLNRSVFVFILGIFLCFSVIAAVIPAAPAGCNQNSIDYKTVSADCANYVLQYYPKNIDLSKVSAEVMAKMSDSISANPGKYSQDVLEGRTLNIAKDLKGISYTQDGKITLTNDKDVKTFDLNSFDKKTNFTIYQDDNGLKRLRVETSKITGAALEKAGNFDLVPINKEIVYESPGYNTKVNAVSGGLKVINGKIYLSSGGEVKVGEVGVSNSGKTDLELALGSAGVSKDYVSFTEKDGIKKINSKISSLESNSELAFQNGRKLRLYSGADVSFSDPSFDGKNYEFAGTGKPVVQGDEIIKYQKVLNALKITDEQGMEITPDGRLGWRTDSAIRAFQTKYGLLSDGVLNDATRNKIKELMGDYSFIDSSSKGVLRIVESNIPGQTIFSLGAASTIFNLGENPALLTGTDLTGKPESYSLAPGKIVSNTELINSNVQVTKNVEQFKQFMSGVSGVDPGLRQALYGTAYAESGFKSNVLTAQYNPSASADNMGELSGGIYNLPVSREQFTARYANDPNAIIKDVIGSDGRGRPSIAASKLLGDEKFMSAMQGRYDYYKNINGGKDYNPFDVTSSTQVMLNLAKNPRISSQVQQDPNLLMFFHQRGMGKTLTASNLQASTSYTHGTNFLKNCVGCV